MTNRPSTATRKPDTIKEAKARLAKTSNAVLAAAYVKASAEKRHHAARWCFEEIQRRGLLLADLGIPVPPAPPAYSDIGS